MTDHLTYEIIMNTGGAIITSRVPERTAELTAKALGMPWPTECSIRWPITIRNIGAKADVEAQALANALRPVVEIPDGEVVVWIAGKHGVKPTDDAGEDATPVLSGEAAIAQLREVVADYGPEWGWIVKVGRTGDALSAPGK